MQGHWLSELRKISQSQPVFLKVRSADGDIDLVREEVGLSSNNGIITTLHLDDPDTLEPKISGTE